MRKVLIGIDIGGTNMKIAAVGTSGKVFARGVLPTHASRGPHQGFERIAAAVPFLLSAGDEIAGCGVGCAGLVDLRTGVLHQSPNLKSWEGTPIRSLAGKILGFPVVVDNDANAAAFGEFARGSGRRSRCFLCLTLGTGVGGGIVLKGELLRGAGFMAGELGHMTIDQDGPRCACGNRGCLEAFIGAGAIVKLARHKLKGRSRGYLVKMYREAGRRLTPKMVAEAAFSGDRVALGVLEAVAGYLGCAIASLVNIFNPDTVAVTGGISGAFDLMRARVKEEVAKRAFPGSAKAVRIVRAELGKDASCVGSALLAWKELSGKSTR